MIQTVGIFHGVTKCPWRLRHGSQSLGDQCPSCGVRGNNIRQGAVTRNTRKHGFLPQRGITTSMMSAALRLARPNPDITSFKVLVYIYAGFGPSMTVRSTATVARIGSRLA